MLSLQFLYFRIARKSTTLTKGCYFSNFQNCYNCDNCCHRDSYLFFPQLPQLQQLLSSGVNCIFFRIAIIATIVMKRDPYIYFFFNIATIATIHVTRIFQNCHYCDNCCHRDSYLFFPQLPQLCHQESTVSVFFQNCHNCNNCALKGSIYFFFQNCNNCDNSCHQVLILCHFFLDNCISLLYCAIIAIVSYHAILQ